MGIWRKYDTDDLNPKPVPADMAPVDFTARDRDIAGGGEVGRLGEEGEEEEEWRFAIVLDGHESEVKSVAWSAGGNLLATCSRDKSVWVWEEVGEDDYETVAVMQEHEGDVKCVAWHPEEELLASGSYDDDVRLWREDVDDWGCCGVLKGHDSTVWMVQWEGVVLGVRGEGGGQEERRRRWVERREKAGPRLVSCSDDLSIRVWRRRPKEKVQQSRLSIIRSGSSEEDWVEEAKLPEAHSRPIYSVAWNKSGRVVSTGGDGAIVVYEERWKQPAQDLESYGTEAPADGVVGEDEKGEIKPDGTEPTDGVSKEGEAAPETGTNGGWKEKEKNQGSDEESLDATEWVIVAKLEGAHGVFEVNHVAWAPRRDRKGESNIGQEDLLVTTGDDGSVKIWTLEV